MRAQKLVLSLLGFVYVRIILAQFLLKQMITFRSNKVLTKQVPLKQFVLLILVRKFHLNERYETDTGTIAYLILT